MVFKERWRAVFGGIGPWFVASIALTLLSMWAVFAWISVDSYRTKWQAEVLFGSNVTALLERDIARTIESYDLSLQAVVKGAQDPRIMALPPDIRRLVLYDYSTNGSGLGAITLTDKNGKVIEDSRGSAKPGIDLSDCDYFITQRDGLVKNQPLLSHPLKSRLTGNYGVTLSRRLTKPDGTFDGVVVGQMTSGFFDHLFRSVRLPSGSSITLVAQDGTMLIRVPEAGRTVRSQAFADRMKGAPSGHFVKHSVFDGVDRLFTYRQIGDRPVYIATGISTQAFLEVWRDRVVMVALGFAVLTGIILLLGVTLGRELARRALAERTLSALAATDALTLLANRRRFDEMLALEWRRGMRDGVPLALLMIDGDFFKAFNDTYGHVEGDRALRALADAIRACIERPGDLAARFGGEEFAVLLPGTDQDGGAKIASAIRRAVNALAFPHEGSPLGVLTVSIGVAARRPTGQEEASSLVEAADGALYTAKAGGRDRIAFDSDEGTVRFGWRRTRSSKVA